MIIHKITSIFLKIFSTILIVFGMLLLIEGCSPEWDGHEGASAIGAASIAFGFVVDALLLWIVTGLAIAIYEMSKSKNKIISIFTVFMSLIIGLFLSYSFLPNELNNTLSYSSIYDNLFVISNREVLFLITGKFIGFLSGTMFVLLAINTFVTRVRTGDNQ